MDDNVICSHCNGQQLCDDDQCDKCFEKSFASHEKSRFWNINNLVKPREIYKNTHKKFLFDCDKCGVTFEKSPNYILCGLWCTHCINWKICDKKDCMSK